MKPSTVLCAAAAALALSLSPGPAALADEGMWLPVLISQRIVKMQEGGCRLSAEDIYSVNQASLKDAVVLFGSGCTGELVSAEGLLFTNHHCGFSYIQRHSSVEHDYLKDGFWAMTRGEELPNPGLTVRFLDRMEDVTGKVLEGYAPGMSEAERESIVSRNSDAILAPIKAQGNGVAASIEPLYYGNQYYLFVYRVYRDVRLVGAPPSSIGKFGGDTDNWMWPRHTGDFSIFRIYADKDGNPADYSPDNVPYTPRKFFRINRKGVSEGDFTMVYGCPGTTREYVPAEEVRYIGEVSDPAKIDLRTKRLEIQRRHMDQSQAVRIQYASKNASTANSWKKWQGEAKGLRRLGAVARKSAYEARFKEWAKGSEYEGVLERLEGLYTLRNPLHRAYEYYNETVQQVEILRFARQASSRYGKSDYGNIVETFFKDYYQPIDEEVFVAMLTAFDEAMPDDYKPAYFKDKLASYGSVQAWCDDLFARTLFKDKGKVLGLTKKDLQNISSDPALELYNAFNYWYQEGIRPQLNAVNGQIRVAEREYMKGQMEFEPDKAFYPDANLTLRVAYGNVKGYSPADAVQYQPVSTLKGIIEKDNPDIYDYNIPQKLRDIYAQGGHEDQPVCFLSSIHTTGGNSGSPLLNADGDLVGINFDRVWEGTMSDLMFDPAHCRNIAIDVRYLLFVVEYIGEASYLFDEMVFVQ